MKGRDADRLAGVLAHCPALAHLDLRRNSDFGAAGAERLAGVLGQCRELAHLNLSGNFIGAGGAESLAGVLPQCTALAHLNLFNNRIEAAGAESLAGVLPQCPALAHLDLCDNKHRPSILPQVRRLQVAILPAIRANGPAQFVKVHDKEAHQGSDSVFYSLI
jgi:Ran GTPase-activating protein (RanGAP) involved in mRNA processing and transport